MRPLASAVICALALSLSACTEDEPPPPPTTATSATTPANPDATLPPMPEVAAEFSAKGAANFVSYYVSMLDYAGKTGDVQALRDASDSECGGCSDYIDLYADTYADGGWFRDRNWTKSETALEFADGKGQESRATTTVTITPGSYRLTSDKAEQKAAETTEVVTFGLRYDESWTMTQFVTGDPE